LTADLRFVETKRVECLSCGARRLVVAGENHHVDAGECQRCGYVGWASSEDLTQSARRQLQDRPVQRRGLRVLFS
jgi:Zn ribbon nucleic-acid-binding protein